MMKKIGFVNSSSSEEEKENDPLGFSFIEEMATRYIDENYSPNGEVEQKEFRTTRELMMEMSEMVSVGMNIVNKILQEKGFKTIFIDGVSNWVMYGK